MFLTEQDNSARLRKFDDAELRRLIVVIYARAESLLHAFGVLHELGDTVRVMSEVDPIHLKCTPERAADIPHATDRLTLASYTEPDGTAQANRAQRRGLLNASSSCRQSA